MFNKNIIQKEKIKLKIFQYNVYTIHLHNGIHRTILIAFNVI